MTKKAIIADKCDFLFLFGHADGDADGKDDRQVAEDDVAGITHDGEQGMKDGPIPRMFPIHRSGWLWRL